jgi:ABC-type antimicrobial peptide transport system, ATPase component
MNNILSLNKVSRSYLVRETLINVFSDIDIDIKKGEKVVIIGPSGSGKTSI